MQNPSSDTTKQLHLYLLTLMWRNESDHGFVLLFSPHEAQPSPCHLVCFAAGQEEQILFCLILKHLVLFDFLPRKLGSPNPQWNGFRKQMATVTTLSANFRFEVRSMRLSKQLALVYL